MRSITFSASLAIATLLSSSPTAWGEEIVDGPMSKRLSTKYLLTVKVFDQRTFNAIEGAEIRLTGKHVVYKESFKRPTDSTGTATFDDFLWGGLERNDDRSETLKTIVVHVSAPGWKEQSREVTFRFSEPKWESTFYLVPGHSSREQGNGARHRTPETAKPVEQVGGIRVEAAITLLTSCCWSPKDPDNGRKDMDSAYFRGWPPALGERFKRTLADWEVFRLNNGRIEETWRCSEEDYMLLKISVDKAKNKVRLQITRGRGQDLSGAVTSVFWFSRADIESWLTSIGW